MIKKRIRHMVIFCLHDLKGSPEASRFLQDGQRILTQIPQVENFEVLLQISPKNDYDYGFSMEFADRDAYTAYNEHPLHVDFVQQRWLKEVARFQEIDFEACE